MRQATILLLSYHQLGAKTPYSERATYARRSR